MNKKYKQDAFLYLFVGLCSVLSFAIALAPTASATPYYVNPGESIQAAVDDASDGDMIIVHDGTYIENIDVDKRLTIRSENGYANVQAANMNDSVFEVTTDYVNITRFTVENSNSAAGIKLNNVKHCNISYNNVSNNNRGIYGNATTNNTILNNTVLNNKQFGIFLKNSRNNTIMNNIASNNAVCGIGLYSSRSNVVEENIVSSNSIENGLGSISLYFSDSNSIRKNKASSDPYGGIVLVFSNKTIIEDNTISNNTYGIYLESSHNDTIKNNTANSNNKAGICLGWSSLNNTIKNNIVNSNNMVGIFLSDSSSNNAIINNNASFNEDFGIVLLSSDYNRITDNYASSNNMTGICLFDSGSESTIKNNTASFNKYFGISLSSSNCNTITGNYANLNYLGIHLYNSSAHNTISNNNVSFNEGGGISLSSSDYNTISNNNASFNKPSGLSLMNSMGNTIFNNSASFNIYQGIYLSNSCTNKISNNNVSSNYFGISLYSSNGNTISNNAAESNYYSEVIIHSSSGNEIVNNTCYIQEEIVYGISLHILEAITPSLQTVEKGTNASYNIVADNLGNSPDTFDLVLLSDDNPKILSLDMNSVFLGAGEISINTTTTTSEIELPQTKVTQVKSSVKTITLNVGDTKPGIYTVKVEIISRHDNTVKDAILTRTIVPGQVDSKLINSPRITKSAIINSSINSSVIDTSAIKNSSISDSTITRSVITNSDIVCTFLDDVIVEDAKVANGNILSGNITINEVEYEISTKTKISELIIGSDHRNSDLVGIKNRTLELNTRNSNTCFNISAEKDYFAASMCVQKSSIPPEGIPEITNNVGGYVYANASANLVNSTDWLFITVFYDQNELGACDESTLKIRYFNETAGSWEDLPVSGINLTGNYVWCNITHYSVFALLAQPAAGSYEGSSGSSRSSGSSSGPHRRPEEVIIPIANPGINIFNFEWLGLDIIEVRTDLERMAINARVGLKGVKKPVEIIDPPGIVYDYFKITTNLKSENVKSACINFRVRKSWIGDNEIATIKMYRHDGDWEELKTETVKVDNNYFYYIAETPGLSIFVITGEREAVEFTQPATTPTPSVPPTTSPVPSAISTATPVPTAIPASAPPAMLSRIGLLIIAVIVASAMIVLVAYLLLRGRKKKHL